VNEITIRRVSLSAANDAGDGAKFDCRSSTTAAHRISDKMVASCRATLYTAADCAVRPLLTPAQDMWIATFECKSNNKAYSMRGFKQPGFAERQKAAMQARENLLQKFRAQPTADDPEVARRRAEREAIAANRARLKQEREAAKAEQKRREEEAAAAEAARIAREKEEAAARQAQVEAEQKAKRDARYAARKAKGRKR